jgi:integrase
VIAAFCALRPSEIFGFRWSSWRESHFQIEGTAWRGSLRVGKAKTKSSKAPVTIPDILFPALKMWREQNASLPDDALIFPTERGTPMRPENWLRRKIKPVAKGLGISGPVNFQVLRRTFATNAQGFGNPKDVQSHLRHTDITTTLDKTLRACRTACESWSTPWLTMSWETSQNRRAYSESAERSEHN